MKIQDVTPDFELVMRATTAMSCSHGTRGLDPEQIIFNEPAIMAAR